MPTGPPVQMNILKDYDGEKLRNFFMSIMENICPILLWKVTNFMVASSTHLHTNCKLYCKAHGSPLFYIKGNNLVKELPH
jgi:hypothetical protein